MSKNLTRITFEVSTQEHKRLKARAATLGISMRELLTQILEMSEECLYSDHIPNKATRQTIHNIENKKNLTEISLDDLKKKYG